FRPDARGRELLDRFHTLCREHGRDPASVGIEGRLNATAAGASSWADDVAAWRSLGASHLCVGTMNDGLSGVDQHLRRLEEIKKAVG
ncbi:MAG: hypothetical protein U0359_15250, partial [Byssovorax sp.]